MSCATEFGHVNAACARAAINGLAAGTRAAACHAGALTARGGRLAAAGIVGVTAILCRWLLASPLFLLSGAHLTARSSSRGDHIQGWGPLPARPASWLTHTFVVFRYCTIVHVAILFVVLLFCQRCSCSLGCRFVHCGLFNRGRWFRRRWFYWLFRLGRSLISFVPGRWPTTSCSARELPHDVARCLSVPACCLRWGGHPPSPPLPLAGPGALLDKQAHRALALT